MYVKTTNNKNTAVGAGGGRRSFLAILAYLIQDI